MAKYFKNYKKAFNLFKEAYSYQTRWFEDNTFEVKEDGIEIYPTKSNDTFFSPEIADILAKMGAFSWYVSYDEERGICARIF